MKDELDKGYVAMQHRGVWLSPEMARARKLWINIFAHFYEQGGSQTNPFSACVIGELVDG